MKSYLYLSLLPEALVASHLAPDDFGSYLATGSKKRARGQAMYFKLSDSYATSELARRRVCASLDPRDQSLVRKSAYLSIYRVLEATPLDALETLHLATEDGRVLTLTPGEEGPEPARRFHLYQELCPVVPRVVSKLKPREFARWVTDKSHSISLPAIVFAELRLGKLGEDIEAAGADVPPYSNGEHLRDCLRELSSRPSKIAKTVLRSLQNEGLFRAVSGGIHVGSATGEFLTFPMPGRDELEGIHFPWWRSALSNFGT